MIALANNTEPKSSFNNATRLIPLIDNTPRITGKINPFIYFLHGEYEFNYCKVVNYNK